MKTFALLVRSLVGVAIALAAVRPVAAQTAADTARLDDLARDAARKFAAANPPPIRPGRPYRRHPPVGGSI
jgi:hypothetical protein